MAGIGISEVINRNLGAAQDYESQYVDQLVARKRQDALLAQKQAREDELRKEAQRRQLGTTLMSAFVSAGDIAGADQVASSMGLSPDMRFSVNQLAEYKGKQKIATKKEEERKQRLEFVKSFGKDFQGWATSEDEAAAKSIYGQEVYSLMKAKGYANRKEAERKEKKDQIAALNTRSQIITRELNAATNAASREDRKAYQEKTFELSKNKMAYQQAQDDLDHVMDKQRLALEREKFDKSEEHKNRIFQYNQEVFDKKQKLAEAKFDYEKSHSDAELMLANKREENTMQRHQDTMAYKGEKFDFDKWKTEKGFSITERKLGTQEELAAQSIENSKLKNEYLVKGFNADQAQQVVDNKQWVTKFLDNQKKWKASDTVQNKKLKLQENAESNKVFFNKLGLDYDNRLMSFRHEQAEIDNNLKRERLELEAKKITNSQSHRKQMVDIQMARMKMEKANAASKEKDKLRARINNLKTSGKPSDMQMAAILEDNLGNLDARVMMTNPEFIALLNDEKYNKSPAVIKAFEGVTEFGIADRGTEEYREGFKDFRETFYGKYKFLGLDTESGNMLLFNRTAGKIEQIEGAEYIDPKLGRVSTGAVEAIGGINASLDAIGKLRSKASEHPDKIGAIEGAWNNLKTLIVEDEDATEINRRAKQLYTLVYDLSGKAVNKEELQRLFESILVQTNMPDANFFKALDLTEEFLKRKGRNKILAWESARMDTSAMGDFKKRFSEESSKAKQAPKKRVWKRSK